MIAPIIPYAFRGAIWYQGETNAFTEESSELYETQLPLLVSDLRDRWRPGDFPFAWVQLPFSSAKTGCVGAYPRVDAPWPTALPNTGMVVTLDLGEERLLRTSSTNKRSPIAWHSGLGGGLRRRDHLVGTSVSGYLALARKECFAV